MEFLTCDYDKEKKIWKSPSVESIYNYKCSVGKIIFNVMQCYPNQICQIDDVLNTKTRNRDALKRAIRIALHLKNLHLGRTDIIGISARNSTHVLPLVLGCIFDCTPFHAVNPTYDVDTLSHCFGLTKPPIIFCDGCDYEKICMATKSYKPQIYTLTDHINGVSNILDWILEPMKMESFYQPGPQIRGAKQTIAILCSSGTTGKPKAVCLCPEALLNENPFFNSESVMLMFSGVDWITGLSIILCNCVTGGTRIITSKPFNAEYFVKMVQKYKINNVFLPPRHLANLVESPFANKEALKSIYTVLSIGGAISDSLVRRLRELLNENAIITYGYGLTEFGGVSVNFGVQKLKGVGKLMPNIQLRITNDNGENLGYNEVGEILLYKSQPWNGYFGNPTETQNMRDAEGWYHTGDLGYMDNQNYLYVVDRKKDILKYQGIHYWPREIEEIIEELPDVVEVCVVGIYEITKGDLAGALVVKTANSSLSEQNIIDYVAKRTTAAHKQIYAGVCFVDAIPQNTNGKISRIAAKEILHTKMGCK